MKHHEAAIARFVSLAENDADTVAVVVAGSVARGEERADSDVDLYVVVTADAYARAAQADRLMYVSDRDVDYPGGYFDVKVISRELLDHAVEQADDPMRASLKGARIVFSRIPELQDLVARIANSTDVDWDARVASFLAQARLHGGYFFEQGVAHGDPMLTAHAAVHLAFAAARALLADAHVLFAGPKYLRDAVAALPSIPRTFTDDLTELVTRQTTDAARRVLAELESRLGERLEADATLTTFIRDNELAWFTRVPPPEYQ
jgi:predicted nucleotidyltransferase